MACAAGVAVITAAFPWLGGGAFAQVPPPPADTVIVRHHIPSPAPATPLGIPVGRVGSGTAWLPDAAGHQGVVVAHGTWDLSMHGTVLFYYDGQSGRRSAGQLGSLNWLMVAAVRSLGDGLLRLRAMVSAEAVTVSEPGYPQLLQVATAYHGQTVADREHPEAPVMETAALYERAIGPDVGLSAYLAAVGEPALGPVSYLHRPSAPADPLVPLGHSVQDITHTSYGVGTIGLFTRALKLEASVFNGAHPDPNAGFAYHVRLDSYSTRLTWNPAATWSLSVWGGRLAASSGAHAHDAAARVGSSALYSIARSEGGAWSTALIWGADIPVATGRPVHTLLVESSVDIGRNTLFGRGEYVQRTAAELSLIGSVPPVLDVGAVAGGYARRLFDFGDFAAWTGVRGTMNVIPAELVPFYGHRLQLGGLLYVSLRPRGRHEMMP